MAYGKSEPPDELVEKLLEAREILYIGVMIVCDSNAQRGESLLIF